MSDTIYGPGNGTGIVGTRIQDLQRVVLPVQVGQSRERLRRLAKIIEEHGTPEDCDNAADTLRLIAASVMEKL